MTYRTSFLIVLLRNISRKLGFNKIIHDYILNTKGLYEENFMNNLLSKTQPGFCVWDIGANIGFYTTKFADLVGSNGLVEAFEPSIENYKKLIDASKDYKNISCNKHALGSYNGDAFFLQGEDDIGATSRLTESKSQSSHEKSFLVNLRTGDSLVEANETTQPNLLKIDVEGFELDVLNGFSEILSNQNLKVIGIEVHFELLKKRGIKPSKIEKILKNNDFEIDWTDPSHIIAERK